MEGMSDLYGMDGRGTGASSSPMEWTVVLMAGVLEVYGGWISCLLRQWVHLCHPFFRWSPCSAPGPLPWFALTRCNGSFTGPGSSFHPVLLPVPANENRLRFHPAILYATLQGLDPPARFSLLGL